MANVDFVGFEWDDGNCSKCQKHGMKIEEIEFVLAHDTTLIVPSEKTSPDERRFLAIGKTAIGRFAFVVFTPKDKGSATVLRPISARYMHGREAKKYEQEIARLQKR